MKFILLSTLLCSLNSFALDCTTKGVASCTNAEGMCFEYTDFSTLPESQLKTICKSMDSEYKSTPCDASFNKGTCLNESNPLMTIIRYNDLIDFESAKVFCEMSGGMICE